MASSGGVVPDYERLFKMAQSQLGAMEYVLFGATLPHDDLDPGTRTCPVCGWPEGGHNGPGRYKGNAENTHEERCSMEMLLKGELAPRMVSRGF